MTQKGRAGASSFSGEQNTVDIVPFHPCHADGVAVLARAEGWPTFSDPARVSRLFVAPGVIGTVAVGDDTVVGAAHLMSDGHHGYLTFLVVAGGNRQRGIGRRLMAAMFEASSAERIDLLSTPESFAFYRSLPHQEFGGFRCYPRYLSDVER